MSLHLLRSASLGLPYNIHEMRLICVSLLVYCINGWGVFSWCVCHVASADALRPYTDTMWKDNAAHTNRRTVLNLRVRFLWSDAAVIKLHNKCHAPAQSPPGPTISNFAFMSAFICFAILSIHSSLQPGVTWLNCSMVEHSPVSNPWT